MSEFSFSKRTKSILENFHAINQSMMFTKGNILRTISASQDFVAVATIPEEIPMNFAIYDLSKFLGAISMYDEPTFLFKEKAVLIRSKEGQQISYRYASPTMILAPGTEPVDTPPTVLSFEMSARDLHMTVKTAALMALPHISFIADGRIVVLEASNLEEKMSESDKHMTKVGETDKIFKAVLKRERFDKLIDGNYKVTVCQEDEASMAVFETNDVCYYIALEAELSKF